jgi:hypothetical protein
MKVEKIIFGQVIRFIDDVREVKKDFSLYEIVRAIQSRYGFLEAPSKLVDYNPQTGMTFLMGKFEGRFIRRFQIYTNGLLCEAETSTDISDRFLDDLIGWLERNFEQRGREKARAYVSQFEVRTEINLGRTFAALDPIGTALAKAVSTYSAEVPKFEISGVRMHYSPRGDEAMPTQFIFERRAESPFSENLYFSSAPLCTLDHENLLREIECVLQS